MGGSTRGGAPRRAAASQDFCRSCLQTLTHQVRGCVFSFLCVSAVVFVFLCGSVALCLCGRSSSRQRLPQILDQIRSILEPNRNPHRPRLHSCRHAALPATSGNAMNTSAAPPKIPRRPNSPPAKTRASDRKNAALPPTRPSNRKPSSPQIPSSAASPAHDPDAKPDPDNAPAKLSDASAEIARWPTPSRTAAASVVLTFSSRGSAETRPPDPSTRPNE